MLHNDSIIVIHTFGSEMYIIEWLRTYLYTEGMHGVFNSTFCDTNPHTISKNSRQAIEVAYFPGEVGNVLSLHEVDS